MVVRESSTGAPGRLRSPTEDVALARKQVATTRYVGDLEFEVTRDLEKVEGDFCVAEG